MTTEKQWDRKERRIGCVDLVPEPKVQFHLWAVLSFLVVLFMGIVTFLHSEQSDTKNKQQAVAERVAILETQYFNIINGINHLTRSVEKTSEKLDDYRNTVNNKKTKMSDLQWK